MWSLKCHVHQLTIIKVWFGATNNWLNGELMVLLMLLPTLVRAAFCNAETYYWSSKH